MKAFVIRFELEHSEPVIWRRVVMPAGATYRRLHDVIQTTTNFQGGYPRDFYHFYEFDLSEENRIVTNNDQAYEEYQHYKKNKKEFEARVKAAPADVQKYEQRRLDLLKREVRLPSGLKIDKYLEEFKEIRYNYDFGDDWWFTIRLEEVVDDYYFGYPTLLDGAETAPPEDVGGIPGFYAFLEALGDPEHPDHAHMQEWKKGLAHTYKEYDPEFLNRMLKHLDYKKTEWDKINHVRYKIVEDKYRG